MAELKVPRTFDHHLKVYERPDRAGTYIADYFLPPQHGEQQLRQRYRIPARNKEQANRWAARKRVALDRHEFDDIDYERMRVSPNDPTLGEFLPEFRKFRQLGRKRPLSPRTIDEQEKIIERFLQKRIGGMPRALAAYRLSEIKKTLVQDFAAALQSVPRIVKRSASNTPTRFLAPKRVNNVLAVLGRILTVAEDRLEDYRRPKIHLVPVEQRINENEALTLDELQRLFAVCEGTYGRMVKFTAITGERAMEVAGTRWEDYDEGAAGGPVLHVVQQYSPYRGRSGSGEKFRLPKCGSQRTLPVGPQLQAILQ